MKLDEQSQDAISRVTAGCAIALFITACLAALVRLVLAQPWSY